MSEYTSFLFARPSFMEGVARLVDFGGLLDAYNTSTSGKEADHRAQTADWRQVGADMMEVAKKGPPTKDQE